MNPKNIMRDQGKTTKLHSFVCMCYILMLLIKGNVIMYLRKITETKPFLALTLKKLEGLGVKLQKYTVFVCMP